MLEKAIEIAVEAHRGQMDKAGKIYILHPMRVMLRGANEEQMIVGILHDTVEDTPITIDMLKKEGFSQSVLDAITCITKKYHENYEHYIFRVLENPLATQIKLYDLEDNMNRERIPFPTKKDEARYEKYEKYYEIVKNQVITFQKEGLL